MDWATFASIVGALGVGSILTQHFASGQDRRQVRADVLGQLASVEDARWAPSDIAPTIDDFTQILREFETAALIARLPREAVRQYVIYAFAARSASSEGVEMDKAVGTYDPELSGGLRAEFADAVRDEANEIAQLAWAPWRGRVRLASRLRKRQAANAVSPGSLKHAESVLGKLPRP